MQQDALEELMKSKEAQYARDTLERYSGSSIELFQPYVLLTNFPKYVEHFAEKLRVPLFHGSMFSVAHAPDLGISILDFKIGSPAAALVVDLCAFLPIKASLLLGMCGGLRRHYEVGEYFFPVAAIRGEGTSEFYFPQEVPAMANFMIQKSVSHILEKENIPFHIGITYTLNKRIWEFNDHFKTRLKSMRPQAIEMECATLFTGGYFHKLPLGALLLISDLPLQPDGYKTKKSSQKVFAEHTDEHIDLGIKIMQHLQGAVLKKRHGLRRTYSTPSIQDGLSPLAFE
ncbi:MAG: nucleosidase [Chlamydiales bacterium]|jgi:AMP nucleosidase|nr:nucleosidase [Chlamydiales bacterium]